MRYLSLLLFLNQYRNLRSRRWRRLIKFVVHSLHITRNHSRLIYWMPFLMIFYIDQRRNGPVMIIVSEEREDSSILSPIQHSHTWMRSSMDFWRKDHLCSFPRISKKLLRGTLPSSSIPSFLLLDSNSIWSFVLRVSASMEYRWVNEWNGGRKSTCSGLDGENLLSLVYSILWRDECRSCNDDRYEWKYLHYQIVQVWNIQWRCDLSPHPSIQSLPIWDQSGASLEVIEHTVKEELERVDNTKEKNVWENRVNWNDIIGIKDELNALNQQPKVLKMGYYV